MMIRVPTPLRGARRIKFDRFGIACLGLAVAAMLPPAVRGEALSPRHVAKLQAATSTVISPDGGHIAFFKAVPRDPYAAPAENKPEFDDGPPWTELHVIRVSDGVVMPFVTGENSLSGLDWTPSGDGISFLTKRGKDKQTSLYVIPLAGGEARRRLAHETDISEYSWSPDGKRVAFLATEKEPKEKKSLSEKGFKAEVYEEDFRFTRAYVAELDSEATPKKLGLEGNVSELRFAPDGKRLALALAATPLIDDHYMFRKAHVVDAESGKVLIRIETPGKLGQIAWSPDGRHLAMIAGEDLNDPAEGRLMVASAEDGKFRELLPGYEAHVSSIAWQDDETVMFIADSGCETVFGKVGLEDGERKIIVPSGGPIFSGLSLSKDGQQGSFVGNTAKHPGEVYFMRHGDEAPRRMTGSNPWLEEMEFAAQEVVRYKARDGLEIEGVLIRPLQPVAAGVPAGRRDEQGKRYPLIVYVHGGPEAAEQNGWLTTYSRPGQVAAARGFAVFYPNYRGSTGRGVKFSKLDQADYGGAEFDDLVDGVKHLVEMGLVDEKRVGVTGGSYGGYAAAWCATALTEHFAASVMFVGISDHTAKVGTTDIPNEMHLVHSLRWPWEGHWDWFRERSPIYHAKKARTPILILHGKDDTRVHPSQSMELYRYLKTIGECPVRLVLYPGEGHGNRKAAARLDYHLRMMQWMEHYLQGEGGEPPAFEIDYDLPKKKDDKKANDEAEKEDAME